MKEWQLKDIEERAAKMAESCHMVSVCTDIPALVAEVRRLQARVAELESRLEKISAIACNRGMGPSWVSVAKLADIKSEFKSETLQEENDRLRGALLFYANPRSWQVDHVGQILLAAVADAGARAREALQADKAGVE